MVPPGDAAASHGALPGSPPTSSSPARPARTGTGSTAARYSLLTRSGPPSSCGRPFSGQSGIGKSELGLELVTRGHGLVADDVVDFIQRAPDWVEGSAPALLANLLEVRGIGLLDIKTIFGETSVRRKMRLNLVAELKQFDQGELMERLPETELFTEVLGQPIRKMIIPVGGGRNLAVLVEAAVRSAILQLRGINTIQEFFDRQRKLMEQEDGF